jgi:hypothetical protein
MREYTFVDVASTPLNKQLSEIFAELDINESNSNFETIGSSFFVRLRNDDPRLPRLIKALDKLPLDPPYGVRREVEYERKDLEAAEYLILCPTKAEKGQTGPLYETDYDFSTGCPECGTGATQTSPLRITPAALPVKGHVALTLNQEFLVDEFLATELRIDLRGECSLRQVEARRSREPLPWWQILPDVSMPPMDPLTEGVSGFGPREEGEGCTVCHRDAYGGGGFEPLIPVYRMTESEQQTLPHFVSTWEHFGRPSRIKFKTGYTIGLAMPMIVMSNFAMQVFLKNKIKGVSFVPVHFI